MLAAAAWLPFLRAPLTSDESGFLLLAEHWHPGTSLYGDYWVDRPPLLLWLFSLAGHLGPTSVSVAGVTAPGVKLLAAAASGVAVILTAVLARLVAPDAWGARGAAVVLTVALLSTRLFGMPEADGEVLAVPFVLLGLVGLVVALRRPWGRCAVMYAAGAGASAMAAALVKQNVIDVFVFAIVLAVLSRGRVPRLAERIAAFAAGAAAALVVTVGAAWTRGTSPVGLWDAIVVFRVRASVVIGASASVETRQRVTDLAIAFLASGGAVVLVVAATAVVARVVQARAAEARGPRMQATADQPAMRTPGMAWPVLAICAWELLGVAAGGSYWRHYLTGVLPGLVTMVAIARPGRWHKRVLTLAVAYTAAASLVVWVHQVASPRAVSPDAQVMSYLRQHAAPTDGVVVGFGHADIVAGSGLPSPYEYLWSLPARVRGPHLIQMRNVMAGPSAPRWIVVAGDSLDSWGLDAASAQRYLERHYTAQVAYGDWHIWQRQGRVPGDAEADKVLSRVRAATTAPDRCAVLRCTGSRLGTNG